MGTRNLTMVIQNGQTKVAQYGQWDGYPEGQGKTALTLLKKMDLNKFREQVSKLRFITDEDAEAFDSEPEDKYPQFNRDTGAWILWLVYDGTMEERKIDYSGKGKDTVLTIHADVHKTGLFNYEEFVKDSLFCEWAYVIDLDKNTFEVYTGFNTEEPLTKSDRFFHYQEASVKEQEEEKKKYPDTNIYYPVKMVKSYDLNALPEIPDFLKDFEEKEEEEPQEEAK